MKKALAQLLFHVLKCVGLIAFLVALIELLLTKGGIL
jgi:hypothetical protein